MFLGLSAWEITVMLILLLENVQTPQWNRAEFCDVVEMTLSIIALSVAAASSTLVFLSNRIVSNATGYPHQTVTAFLS